MKKQELKYIKLFEAFESIKLSKTLGFIDKNSKNEFISQLKILASKIELPFSKYSDDYFQYLPFKKALALNYEIKDEPCDATSREQFPRQFSIAGETCKEGKLKRLWAGRPRSVTCPSCNGSGIKKRTTFDIKWIKFWFDKDGKYIITTGTDGKVREQLVGSDLNLPDVSNIVEISNNISDYTKIYEIKSRAELSNFETGTYIKINISGTDLIARIFREDNHIYAIQNYISGSNPRNDESWRKYGNRSWEIGGGDYRGTPFIILPKSIKYSKLDEVNPYTWNALIDFRRFTLSNNENMKKNLSNAHFAIVLDYLELKKSKFKTRGEISSEREQQKLGATAFITDDEVRKANINRYIQNIVKNISISSDFSNMSKMVFRFLGARNFGYYVLRGRHFSDFNDMLTQIFRFLKETDDSEKNRYYNWIVSMVKSKSEINGEFNIKINQVLQESYKLQNSKEDIIKVIKKVEELNVIIYDKFKSSEIESLDDLEVFYEKISSIRNVWKNSERYDNNGVYYAIEHLSDANRFNSYLNNISDTNKILEDLERFIKFIQKI